jgi:hypothetical protein
VSIVSNDAHKDFDHIAHPWLTVRETERWFIKSSEGDTAAKPRHQHIILLNRKDVKFAETRSAIAINLIAVYKALGGGWELREGKPVVPEAVQAEMAARTNWGTLLPAPSPPTTPDLPLPTPAGDAPILLPPDM